VQQGISAEIIAEKWQLAREALDEFSVLGHPLGCSGARLMTTLVNILERTGGRYGLQTMCEGGGMANATIVERLD
jgi:acetyl-CoA acetyltransferase